MCGLAKWLIRTFTTESGGKPVEDWISSLGPGPRSTVLSLVGRLEREGVDLRKPFVEHLGGGLWELRARDGDGIYRVIYFHWKGRTFGLLHGFTKKTRKTPANELAIAKARHATWLARQKRNRDG